MAVNNKQLKGHGKNYHKDGFSSPVGKLIGHEKSLEDLTSDELRSAGIETGKEISLTFESGITVSGKVADITTINNKNVLIKVEKCTVLDEKRRVLFDPSWGVYDMAVGEQITSVFCGAADKDVFLEIVYKSKTGTHHPEYDQKTKELHQLYQQVRNRRHNGGDLGFLGNVWMMLQKFHHDDWLCALEILELLDHEGAEPTLAAEIKRFLQEKAAAQPEYKKLINDGLYLIKHPVEEKLVV